MQKSRERQTAVVVFSGGQDSTTCLYLAIEQGYKVHCVTINYGQRHIREIESAIIIAEMAGVTHEIIDVPMILKGTSPLVSDSKLEQYKDHASLPGGLEKTFVPMRNQFFLTLAANRAFCLGASVLITGVCEEDYGGYPDCRRRFIDSLEIACRIGTFTEESGYGDNNKARFIIMTPLMYMTKRETVDIAVKLPGCYEALAYSHTAYDGAYPPIGRDHATLLRAKGFEEAGVPDPLVLRAVYAGLMSLPESKNYSPQAVQKYAHNLF